MNLKIRLALLFSAIVAFILIVISSFIYLSYRDLRKEAFYNRLEKKAKTTAKFLIEVREIDHNILRAIDDNTIHELYEEKVLVFDSADKLIYSSIDDHKITYSKELLKQIRKEKLLEYTENNNEVVGILYNANGEDNVILASAYDRTGLEKLRKLLYILIVGVIIGLFFTGIAAYYYVREMFLPLEILNNKITYINASNLQQELEVKAGRDEITKLAENFNLMLRRLAFSFESQKSFVQSASHELRTPLATLTSQIEKAQNKDLSTEEYKKLLSSLQEDLHRLTRIINSLLFLSRYDKLKLEVDAQKVPVDTILFKSIAEVKEDNTQANINLSFSELPEREDHLQVYGYETILQSAFVNLIENACKYSDNNSAQIYIYPSSTEVTIHIYNTGQVINEPDEDKIFQPFFRGNNSVNKRGFGLGLSIVKRVIEAHSGKIRYQPTGDGENTFIVTLPLKIN